MRCRQELHVVIRSNPMMQTSVVLLHIRMQSDLGYFPLGPKFPLAKNNVVMET